MTWLSENIGSLCVFLGAVLFIAFLTVSLIRSKKKASSGGCPGGCAGCTMADKCHAARSVAENEKN